jgi:hypothetical protein
MSYSRFRIMAFLCTIDRYVLYGHEYGKGLLVKGFNILPTCRYKKVPSPIRTLRGGNVTNFNRAL